MKYMIKEKNSILQQYGFEWDTFATDESIEGWQQVYSHGSDNYGHDNLYCLWVNICPKDNTIYFYDEFDCGGELWSDEEAIPDDMDIESEEFIQWLDNLIAEQIERWN